MNINLGISVNLETSGENGTLTKIMQSKRVFITIDGITNASTKLCDIRALSGPTVQHSAAAKADM
jgi:hypothetical protein